MYKTYFKQAIQLLKQNPFISTISILGTALAIMMIMVIIVSNSIHNVSVKPEVNRSKSFYSFFYAVRDTANGSEWLGQLKYEEVRDYFHSLQTPEEVTAFEANSLLNGYRKSTVQREGDKELHKIRMRFVDNAFWRVFAFDFVQGAPFTQEEFESGVRKAVISESTAQRLFKGENPIGKNMLISNISYNVAGVVKDVSQVFSKAYGDVFAPYTSKQGYDKQMSYLVLMLMKSSRDHSRLAEELRSMERKYEALHPDRNYTLGMWGHSDIEAVREHISSYGYDSITIKVTDLLQTVLLFLTLLLVPALNLSGFSVSRMKKRTEEIGIRKAFGARTGTLLFQVLYENIITSFIGGIIGLILSYAAILLMRGWILGVDAGEAIPLQALISPTVFATVILSCVLLSIMSSGISALRATRMSIVKSISKSERQ